MRGWGPLNDCERQGQCRPTRWIVLTKLSTEVEAERSEASTEVEAWDSDAELVTPVPTRVTEGRYPFRQKAIVATMDLESGY